MQMIADLEFENFEKWAFNTFLNKHILTILEIQSTPQPPSLYFSNSSFYTASSRLLEYIPIV